jgi:hypothetical protein
MNRLLEAVRELPGFGGRRAVAADVLRGAVSAAPSTGKCNGVCEPLLGTDDNAGGPRFPDFPVSRFVDLTGSTRWRSRLLKKCMAGYGDPALQCYTTQSGKQRVRRSLRQSTPVVWIPRGLAFSLVEVVVAIGLVGVSLVTTLGLLAATTRSAADLNDSQGSASLGGSIQAELDRLKDSLGLAGLANLVPLSGAGIPLRLVGTRDGLRVRCVDAVDAAANRSQEDSVLPGIADRDRYYLIEVTREAEWGADPGFVVLNARCAWPYELPVGPAPPGAAEQNAAAVREVPAADRHVMVQCLAITP